MHVGETLRYPHRCTSVSAAYVDLLTVVRQTARIEGGFLRAVYMHRAVYLTPYSNYLQSEVCQLCR
jgi:hypothetical protein